MTSSTGSVAEVELVLDARASTAESPTWSEREQALYWIDIEEPALHRLDPLSGEDRSWEMPSQIGAFALAQSGGVLAALRMGLVRVELSTSAYALLAPPPYNPRTHRFNGGKCDASGRFWIGTMFKPLRGVEPEPDEAGPRERAKPIHRLAGAGGLEPVEARATIANGFTWSPDHRTMYLTDSETRTIHAYDFDLETGNLSSPKVLRRFEPTDGKPDGAAVDVEGYYWCALNGGGRVVRLAPDGRTDREIVLPVSQPTMCAFGGRNLDILYVTSAASGLDEEARRHEPHAGGLFRCRPGVRGLRPHLFVDEAER